MHLFAELVIAVALVGLTSCAFLLLDELRQIRLLLERPPRKPITYSSSHVGPRVEPGGGYGVYIFRDGRWHLEADFSRPGFEATPPTIPGQFSGQVVKRESTVRKLEA